MTEDAINKVEMMLLTLIEKSEGRIEKTNDMIGKCLAVIDRVSGEYTIQIKKLQESRDELMRQNGDLIKMLERKNREYEVLNNQYNHLIDKMVGKSENNINVN